MAWMFTRIDFSMTASSGRKPVRPGSLAGGRLPAFQLANQLVGRLRVTKGLQEFAQRVIVLGIRMVGVAV